MRVAVLLVTLVGIEISCSREKENTVYGKMAILRVVFRSPSKIYGGAFL